ncbi:MAG TPA: putative sugar nucleotidyl transferase [Candidatus Cloacimonadota bacterium]|nr:putative sugar nucleotidyl transferase [Candidatus Cloacimonadota bacterium]HQB40194.1 putative sugar nucleotidyl transferase [Candidatus Cloacimonadota bacterium]
MKYVIFDDHKKEQFLPMTYLRLIGDLRVGILKLRQRIEYLFEIEQTNYIMDNSLFDLYKERHPDWCLNYVEEADYIFINSRAKINYDNIQQITGLKQNAILKNGENIIAFHISCKAQNIDNSELIKLSETCQTVETQDIHCWEYLWEMMHENGQWITFDFENIFYEVDNYIETELGVTLINPYDIWIGEGAELKAGVVIDASNGPVVIDENATIMHNSVIIGPAYIGKKAMIKVAAKIYPNTSIGPVCKVGGEVEDTIIQGYSNKQHDGFLGHSFIGEWVNIGADTNNSDLKNTYKNVAVYNYSVRDKIETGSTFVGCFIGDHSKIGINCSINTGALIGFGANLYGSPLIQNFIPNFSWGQADHLDKYQIEKFLSTAKIVKNRRNKELSINEIEIIKDINKRGI